MSEQVRPGRPSFWRRNALVLLLGSVLLAMVVGLGLSVAERLDQARAAEQRVAELQGQIDQAKETHAQAIDEAALDAMGVDRARLVRDSQVLSTFLRTAFTWDSGQSYEAARTTLKERYALAESDPFLKDFLPPSRYTEDAAGDRYYYVDTMGINSSFSGEPDVQVSRVRADRYSYVVRADVTVTSDNVRDMSERRPMLLMVTVDGERGLGEISGIPAGSLVRQSG